MKFWSKYGIPRDFNYAADNNPCAVSTKKMCQITCLSSLVWCGTQSKIAEGDIRVLDIHFLSVAEAAFHSTSSRLFVPGKLKAQSSY